MSIGGAYSPPQYTGNGVTVAFAVPYPFFAAADLVVGLFDTNANALVVPQPTLGGAGTYDYTVAGVADTLGTGEFLSGTVTFNNAPLGNHRVVLARSVVPTQPAVLPSNGPLPAKSVEAALDRRAMVDQQQLALALTIPPSDPPGTGTVLPLASARASKYLAFDAAGNPIPAAAPVGTTVQGLTGLVALGAGFQGQCRLTFVDANHVALVPYGGSLVQIAGVLYQLPAGGISALISSCFVNGVAAQALAASTAYFVYVFNNGGTLALDFSTTAHVTDTIAGNIGVEGKSGDNSRSLVGWVQTTGAPAFVQSASNVGVLSWFNRRNLPVQGAVSNATTTSATFVEIATASRVTFGTWGDEAVQLSVTGEMSNSGANNLTNASLQLDATTGAAAAVAVASVQNATASNANPSATGGTFVLAEGAHFATPVGDVAAGTGTFKLAVFGVVRG